VTNNNALLARLEKKGKRKPFSGGRQILQEIEYGENATFNWYSGYDPLNIQPSDVFTAAVFDWKQCAVAVRISGLEELQNGGEEQMIESAASTRLRGLSGSPLSLARLLTVVALLPLPTSCRT
jgi:hypothetical protein